MKFLSRHYFSIFLLLSLSFCTCFSTYSSTRQVTYELERGRFANYRRRIEFEILSSSSSSSDDDDDDESENLEERSGGDFDSYLREPEHPNPNAYSSSSSSDDDDDEIERHDQVTISQLLNRLIPRDSQALTRNLQSSPPVLSIDSVPETQFANSNLIMFLILCLSYLLDPNTNYNSRFIRLSAGTLTLLLAVFLQLYFGRYFYCQVSCDTCSLQFGFERFHFQPENSRVSLERWALAPLAWITEIIVLLPHEYFLEVQNILHWPSKAVFLLVFFVQMLHYWGVFELFRRRS